MTDPEIRGGLLILPDEDPLRVEVDLALRRAVRPATVHEALTWAYYPRRAARIRQARRRKVLHEYMRGQRDDILQRVL